MRINDVRKINEQSVCMVDIIVVFNIFSFIRNIHMDCWKENNRNINRLFEQRHTMFGIAEIMLLTKKMLLVKP
mgnify:CR=1 FL=1